MDCLELISHSSINPRWRPGVGRGCFLSTSRSATISSTQKSNQCRLQSELKPTYPPVIALNNRFRQRWTRLWFRVFRPLCHFHLNSRADLACHCGPHLCVTTTRKGDGSVEHFYVKGDSGSSGSPPPAKDDMIGSLSGYGVFLFYSTDRGTRAGIPNEPDNNARWNVEAIQTQQKRIIFNFIRTYLTTSGCNRGRWGFVYILAVDDDEPISGTVSYLGNFSLVTTHN